MRVKINRGAIINIIVWFISFGLSFLIQALGWTNQGTAFLYIYCFSVLVISVLSMIKIVTIVSTEMSFILGGFLILVHGITFLFAWGAAQLFNMNFAIAFQLITLGQVMIHTN